MANLIKKILNFLNKNKNNENSKNLDVKKLKKDEARLLKSKTTYDFFGYIMDESRELPAFLSETTFEGGINLGEMFYPFTPKLLVHCVENLTEHEKMIEANDIEYFKEKCYRLAKASAYQEESWQEAIEELVKYLEHYKNLEVE